MNKPNIQECEIVQDLLPLYYDDACSPASKVFVGEHLKNCEKCREMYKELNNNSLDNMLQKESADVLERHAKHERNRAYKAGVVIAGLLLIPVLITLLVAMGGGTDMLVFAVVAASMFLVAALTVVPMISSQKRAARSILAGIAALLLIYFFVDRMNGGGEFLLWAVPTIFGLSVVFLPFVIRSLDLPAVLADKKALITMAWDTLWLFLTIFTVCEYEADIEGMRAGYTISLIMMIGVWLIFLIARYLSVNPWIKAGMITWVSCVWMVFSQDVYSFFYEHRRQITILAADFSDWSDPAGTNANIYVVLLIAGGIAGAAFILYGIWKKRK